MRKRTTPDSNAHLEPTPSGERFSGNVPHPILRDSRVPLHDGFREPRAILLYTPLPPYVPRLYARPPLRPTSSRVVPPLGSVGTHASEPINATYHSLSIFTASFRVTVVICNGSQTGSSGARTSFAALTDGITLAVLSHTREPTSTSSLEKESSPSPQDFASDSPLSRTPHSLSLVQYSQISHI